MGSSLAGSLNFIAFCLDPTLQSAVMKTYKRLTSRFKVKAWRRGSDDVMLTIDISSELSSTASSNNAADVDRAVQVMLDQIIKSL
ncbi:hypothetical protein K502DRAFT_354132 [Neoconidiobolus thromboides FSU 785]|nr:hypothetical protein K502DRAFT_354132 [Neoconidiobolus thromboides FSU 785]